jgi:Fibronectin type III domain
MSSIPSLLPDEPAPGSPGDVVCSPGDSRVSLSWVPAQTGGVPQYYTVVSTSLEDGETTTTYVTHPITWCQIDGLTNGWRYSFQIFASNSAGNSPVSVSDVMLPSIPLPLPGRPIIQDIEAGNGRIRVSWSACYPGGPVSQYIVAATPAGHPDSSDAVIEEYVPAVPTNAVIGNMKNELAYFVTVRGINQSGQGPDSLPSLAVTPSAVICAPLPVFNLVVSYGHSRIFVSWVQTVGGGPVNHYELTAIPVVPVIGEGSTTVVVPGNMSWGYITGVQNDAKYTVQVVAVNVEGSSSPATFRSVVVPRLPTPPNPVMGLAFDDVEGSVSWVPSPSGPVPDKYCVIATNTNYNTSPVYSQVPFPQTTCAIDNLRPGNTYSIQVVAVLSNFASSPAVINAFVPEEGRPVKAGLMRTGLMRAGFVTGESLPLPGQVTGVYATPGNESATVHWTAPSSGGAVQSYQILATSVATGNSLIYTASYLDNSSAVFGLTNGTAYTFTVTANNATGAGPASAASSAATPEGSPASVSSVSIVSVTSSSVTISWVPNLTGGTIASFSVYAVGVAGSPFSAGASATQLTIQGLSANSTYNNAVFVMAVNSVATSQPTYAPSFTTPPNTPGVVLGVQAIAGVGAATVSWVAPVTGGTPATYVATATPVVSGADVTTTVNYPQSSCVLSGLTNGVAYTVAVAARNAAGFGASSTSTISFVPQGVPAAVTSISIVSTTSNSVTVSWTPDLTAGNVQYYYVYATTINGSPFTVNSPNTQYTVGGLMSGTTYNNLIYIVAANAVASSSPTYAPSFTTGTLTTLPGAPLAVNVVAGNASARVSWSIFGTGGTPDTFDVIASPTSGGSPVSTSVSYPSTLATLTGLSNAVSYSVSVSATNTAGTGPSSSAIEFTPQAPPNPVQSISVDGVTNNSVTLSWVPDTSGGSIDFYYVTAPNIVGSPFTVRAPATSGTFSGFQPGVTYRHYVRVTAANTLSSSTSVYAPDFTTLTPPEPVELNSVVIGDGSAVVTWTDLLLGGVPEYYTVSAISQSATETSTQVAFVPDRAYQSVTIDGLTNNAPYTFSVTATNSIGSSAPVVSSTYTPQASPNPVRSVSVDGVGDGSVSLSWVPDNSGALITNFVVTFVGVGGSPFIVNFPTAVITIAGLVNNVTYQNVLSVAAQNAIGTSEPVYADPFTPMMAPMPVLNFAVIAGDASATTSWSQALTGGPPSTYTVSATTLTTGIDPVSTTVDFPLISAALAGLSNLVTYSFTATATNAAGSAITTPARTVRIGAPGPVRSVSAIAGDTQATVYWTGTLTGGTPSNYLITLTPTTSGVVVTSSVPYPASNAVVSGLINGTTYVVTVTSENGAGDSSVTTSVNAVTPFSNTVTPGGGGDPHVVTIHGEHYLLPNHLKRVELLDATDVEGNAYSVIATTRLLTKEELRSKKAFCVARVLDKNKGFASVRTLKYLDGATVESLAEQSCFDTFTVSYNAATLGIDAFTGRVTHCDPADRSIGVVSTLELMKTSVGECYYPRTPLLRSFKISFGKVIMRLSVDRTYADINYVRFVMDSRDFPTLNGAVVNRIV